MIDLMKLYTMELSSEKIYGDFKMEKGMTPVNWIFDNPYVDRRTQFLFVSTIVCGIFPTPKKTQTIFVIFSWFWIVILEAPGFVPCGFLMAWTMVVVISTNRWADLVRASLGRGSSEKKSSVRFSSDLSLIFTPLMV